MSREIPIYFKNFQTAVLNKLSKHENWLSSLDNRLSKVELGLEDIQEKVSYLPKLYRAVDSFMKEIRENRDERVFINHHLNDHEERIARLENTD